MPRPRPILAYAFFLILGFLCAGYLGKVVVDRVKADGIKQRVMDIVAANKEITASEIRVNVSDDARIVKLSGFVPSQKIADEVTGKIRSIIRGVKVNQQFTLEIPRKRPSNAVAATEKTPGNVSVVKALPISPVPTDNPVLREKTADTPKFEFEYRFGVVALSIAIASLGCFAGLLLTGGIDVHKRNETFMRLIFGGLSVGGSIWSMHFIGMLAIRMPLIPSYDATLMAASAFIAVAVTGFALAAVGLQLFGSSSLVLAGITMGLGVGAMHYTGMAAIQGECSASYTRMSVAIAVIISIEACLIALHAAFYRKRGLLGTCLGSIALGLAIASTHYSAMEGTRFLPNALSGDISPAGLSGADLALSVALVAYTVCSLSIVLYSWIVFRTHFRHA